MSNDDDDGFCIVLETTVSVNWPTFTKVLSEMLFCLFVSQTIRGLPTYSLLPLSFYMRETSDMSTGLTLFFFVFL